MDWAKLKIRISIANKQKKMGVSYAGQDTPFLPFLQISVSKNVFPHKKIYYLKYETSRHSRNFWPMALPMVATSMTTHIIVFWNLMWSSSTSPIVEIVHYRRLGVTSASILISEDVWTDFTFTFHTEKIILVKNEWVMWIVLTTVNI